MALKTVKNQTHLGFSDNKGLLRTATEYFLVTFDAPASPGDAELASGVPNYGDPWTVDGVVIDSLRTMQHKRAQAASVENAQAGRYYWQVQCDYTTENDVTVNPLTQPGVTKWTFSEDTENYFIDNSTTPKPVVNSAGEPFEKLPERKKSVLSAVFTKYYPATFSALNFVAVADQINPATFTLDGIAISGGTCKFGCGELGTPTTIQLGSGGTFTIISYRQGTVNLAFLPNWNDVFEDRGLNYLQSTSTTVGTLVTSTTKLAPIVQGTPPAQVKKGFPLNGSGQPQSTPTVAGASLTFAPYTTSASMTGWNVFSFN